MTTYFPFTPSTQSVPQFQPTLDGTQYSATLTWSLFGQRYYVNLYTLSGTLVFCRPLIESLASLAIEDADWDPDTSTAQITTSVPHGYAPGASIELTIADMVPAAYNGLFLCLITGPDTFSYPVSIDPGLATQTGDVSYLISMTAGYFDSTMVYRNGQFEINP